MASHAKRWPWAGAIALVVLAGTAWAAPRTWTDNTGQFRVSAELVAAKGDKVVLRRADGTQFEVPLQRLSDKDRAFVKAQQPAAPAADPQAPSDGKAAGHNEEGRDTQAATTEIAKAAKLFFADLRGTDRSAARGLLTAKAQPLMQGSDSPMKQLPQPASGTRAITAGKVEIKDAVATIPVRVRAGGKLHNTTLHFRRDADHWRIFAISAVYPDGEKSINFEAEIAREEPGAGPPSMIGQPMELAGITLNGRPLDMRAFQGKVVLVDFWATWCGPCRAEIPNILETWNRYHDKGFEVIAISVDQDVQALQAFVAKEQPPWTVVADNHPANRQSMGSKYGIRGIPAFYLLGRDGKVAAVNCRGPRLAQEVARLMAAGG